jgi:hypothetical protein
LPDLDSNGLGSYMRRIPSSLDETTMYSQVLTFNAFGNLIGASNIIATDIEDDLQCPPGGCD